MVKGCMLALGFTPEASAANMGKSRIPTKLPLAKARNPRLLQELMADCNIKPDSCASRSCITIHEMAYSQYTSSKSVYNHITTHFEAASRIMDYMRECSNGKKSLT